MNENELRDRIGGAFGVEPPSSGFESRMRSALMSPPPRRRVAVRWPLEVAAGLIAVVVVVALTLTHVMNQPAGGLMTPPGTVPWADLPAPNVAQPFTKPGVPACRASQLVFDVHVADPSYIGAGPANTSSWNVTVINTAPAQCFVGPTMDVSFATAQGDLHLAPQRWPGDPVYLNYMDQAVGEIDTFPCALPRVTRMTISPGQGLGSVTLDPGPAGGFGSPCPNRNQTYLVELTADNGPRGGHVAATRTAMQAPVSARPGDRMRYLITITNRMGDHFGLAGHPDPTPSPLAWSPCPTFHMELEGVEATFHTYRLNCAAAQPIAPNGSETFEMFIDVPANAHPGPATLVWSIDGSPEQWARATAFVSIES